MFARYPRVHCAFERVFKISRSERRPVRAFDAVPDMDRGGHAVGSYHIAIGGGAVDHSLGINGRETLIDERQRFDRAGVRVTSGLVAAVFKCTNCGRPYGLDFGAAACPVCGGILDLSQPLVFVIMLAATLFGTAGRIDIVEFWVYIAIVAAVSALSLTILDTDLMQERMRPGGRRVGRHFLPLIIIMFLHWAVAGLDRGHLHLSDKVKPGLEVVALVLFALAWIVLVWAM